jgi:hypothetical protein
VVLLGQVLHGDLVLLVNWLMAFLLGKKREKNEREEGEEKVEEEEEDKEERERKRDISTYFSEVIIIIEFNTFVCYFSRGKKQYTHSKTVLDQCYLS